MGYCSYFPGARLPRLGQFLLCRGLPTEWFGRDEDLDRGIMVLGTIRMKKHSCKEQIQIEVLDKIKCLCYLYYNTLACGETTSLYPG